MVLEFIILGNNFTLCTKMQKIFEKHDLKAPNNQEIPT